MEKCAKFDYGTKAAARKASIAIDKKSSNKYKMKVYKCDRCGGWHIGRQRRHGKKFK